MSSAKKVEPDEMRFSGAEFDRIMGQVLQAKPKLKKAVKAKVAPKKTKLRRK